MKYKPTRTIIQRVHHTDEPREKYQHPQEMLRYTEGEFNNGLKFL